MQDTAISAGLPPADNLPVPPGLEEPPRIRKSKPPLYLCLEILASLRITVVLFVLSLALVFYGTWAQMEMSIWSAVDNYFKSWIVMIPLRIVFCYGFPDIPGVLPFPGGKLIGSLMLINLLAAHAVRFKLSWKRFGILLTHAGLIVMLVGEWVRLEYALEGHMRIEKGASANYLEHDRFAELAVIDFSDLSKDQVVAIPGELLQAQPMIKDERLPFHIEVNQYMVNSILVDNEKGKTNLATTSVGLALLAEDRPEVSGADPKQPNNVVSAYITFKRKDNGQSLGTYLLSYYLSTPQKVNVDGKTYHVHLRLKRSYKPFTLHLLEFRHDRYVGTGTAKNYESRVRLVDPTTSENREVRIYMNNPLHYRGETFYQSGVLPGDAGTILQVVRNPGQLLPYVSCCMVILGMLLHFGERLGSFLGRITG